MVKVKFKVKLKVRVAIFRIFPVSQNGENRLGDEGADGAMSPRIFRLEPPLAPAGFLRGILVIHTYTQIHAHGSWSSLVSGLYVCTPKPRGQSSVRN